MTPFHLTVCSADRLARTVYRMDPPCDLVISFNIPRAYHKFFPAPLYNLPVSPVLSEELDDPAWQSKWRERQLFLCALDIERPQAKTLNGETVRLEAPPADLLVRAFEHFDRFAPTDRPVCFVVNCWEGLSRSTATALALMARLNPGRSARDLVADLLALRPPAIPNRAIVAQADALLGRKDCLLEAVDTTASIQNRRLERKRYPVRILTRTHS